MKDYYTLKEIILGLRKEQLRIAKELQALEKKLDIYGKKQYEGSSLVIKEVINIKSDPWKLSLLLHEKYTLLENLLYALTLRFQKIERGQFSSRDLIKTPDDNYRLFGVKIKEKEQISFNTLADLLLSDQFVKNASLILPIDPNHRFRNYLNVQQWQTSYYGSPKRKIDSLEYNARTDSFLITNHYHHKTYQEIINELLALKFPKTHFSAYLQSIIDNGDDQKMEIILPNERIYRDQAEFYLNDERHGYVLVKKQ